MTAMSMSARAVEVADTVLGNARMAKSRIAEREIRLSDVRRVTQDVSKIQDLNDIFTAAAYNTWRADSKVAVAIDPDMLSEIVEAHSFELPGDVFKRLPYVNPLVVFPVPIETVSSSGENTQVLGFFTYGRIDAEIDGKRDSYICSTDDPSMNRIGFIFVSYVPETKMIDFTRVSADLHDRFSVRDAVVDGVKNFQSDWSVPNVTRRGVVSWFAFLLSLGLNVSLYIASSGADMEKMPKSVSSKPSAALNWPGTRPSGLKMIKMGWKLGPALRRARDKYGASQSLGTDGSRTHGPHPVVGHFRGYWTGKGRTDKVVKFIAPHWTRRDLIDEFTPNVLVRN